MLRLDDLPSLPADSFYVVSNGKVVSDWRTLDGQQPYSVCLRVLGGKGGFGSLLRSFRIYRSTNQDMCRDLSGRRMKDVKEEQKLKKWIDKAAEREREKEAKRQAKYDKLKAGPPKHDFDDPEFGRVRDEILENTDDALEQGLKRRAEGGECSSSSAGVSRKRRGEATAATSKKKRAKVAAEHWLAVDAELSSESEEDESTDDEEVVEEEDWVEDETEGGETEPAEDALVEPVVESPPPEPEPEPVVVEAEAKTQPPREPVELHPIDLGAISSVDEAAALGLDQLKFELSLRGLKCGGSLAERAARLVSVKGLQPADYPKKALAKK